MGTMAFALAPIAGMLLLAALSAAAQTAASCGHVVVLTESNFDSLVNHTSPSWMIDVYAPWCPACQEMASAWEQLADELHPDIRVGKIDGTKENGLLQRFSVRHFPSIYFVHGRETREYLGDASVSEMAKFARGGWRSVPPRTGCSSPVSRCGTLVGSFTKVPARLKDSYFELRERKRYSDVSLLAGILALPVTLGLMCICMLDAYYTRRVHPHQL